MYMCVYLHMLMFVLLHIYKSIYMYTWNLALPSRPAAAVRASALFLWKGLNVIPVTSALNFLAYRVDTRQYKSKNLCFFVYNTYAELGSNRIGVSISWTKLFWYLQYSESFHRFHSQHLLQSQLGLLRQNSESLRSCQSDMESNRI